MTDHTDRAAAPLHLLVINPNTSEAITARLQDLAEDEARAKAGGDVTVHSVTARFGAPYISDRAGARIAADAVLDAAQAALARGPRPDAILIGCFGDPGFKALQQIAPCPVVGFAEAGLLEAAAAPGPFMVATNGEAWCEMLSELAASMGLSDRISSFLSVGDEAARDAVLCRARITEEAERTTAVRVELGGAGLIPILADVAAGLPLPLVDPHRAAIRKAIALARRA